MGERLESPGGVLPGRWTTQKFRDRQVVFASDDDYLYYLDNLREWKERLECKVYSYCLMANHVHLIVDPGSDGENLSLLIKRVAGRQTRHVNKLERRSGTLWEGRIEFRGPGRPSKDRK